MRAESRPEQSQVYFFSAMEANGEGNLANYPE